MVTDTLRKLGLSEGEIRIYTALLDLGSSPLNKIHETVGIERRNIYDILNKLIERGLVTYITENKKRVFKVTHPSKIAGYIEEKIAVLETTKEHIKEEIPQLLQRFEAVRSPVDAQLYRGAEGIKAVWEDMLAFKTTYWIGSGRYVPKTMPHFFANWNRRRIKLGVKWRNLMRFELRREIRKTEKLEELRYLPKEFSGNPTVTCIYGDKVAQFLFGAELFAFVIESNELAENYRAYHKYLWENIAKP